MGHFNKEEFGERLKVFRKAKGYSLDYVGLKIKKNATTVGRYENAEIMPDAETISLLCEVLGISEYELFKSDEKINNKENSKNPFNTNRLYLYYNAYYAKSDRYDKGKFVLNIIPYSHRKYKCKIYENSTQKSGDKLRNMWYIENTTRRRFAIWTF